MEFVIMEFVIKKLPKVSLDNVNQLPTSPGIYFVIDTANRVWFVSYVTDNLRLYVTEKVNDMVQVFYRNRIEAIAYFPWSEVDDLRTWYEDCLRKFKPIFNGEAELNDELPISDLGYSRHQYLARYKELKTMAKAIDAELEELKPNIVSIVEDNDGKIKTDEYMAYLGNRTVYEYSDEIRKLEEVIRVLKKQEENNGAAKVKSVSLFPIVR